MVVLHIVSSIDESSGGPSRSVPQSCMELAKLGIEVKIITKASKNPVKIQVNKNLSIIYKSTIELFLYGLKLKKNEVDLIHIQHIWNPYVNVMAYCAMKKQIPYIITPRGMLEPWILARNPWKKKLALWLYQNKTIHKANRLHATAQMEADNIKKIGYLNPITIIPNGIDLNEVKSVKSKYGTKKMIFLSRIHPKKGIEFLLEAWNKTNTENWTLEIAGNGEESYIDSLKNSSFDLKNVYFVGSKYDEDKWDFIRSADIMVLPTFSENFGIVVAEALAVGVPVLTTKGTPWEDLETHNCGWWFDLSVETLKNSIIKAIETSENELSIMGKNGIKLIQENYDIRKVASSISEMYKNVLNH